MMRIDYNAMISYKKEYFERQIVRLLPPTLHNSSRLYPPLLGGLAGHHEPHGCERASESTGSATPSTLL